MSCDECRPRARRERVRRQQLRAFPRRPRTYGAGPVAPPRRARGARLARRRADRGRFARGADAGRRARRYEVAYYLVHSMGLRPRFPAHRPRVRAQLPRCRGACRRAPHRLPRRRPAARRCVGTPALARRDRRHPSRWPGEGHRAARWRHHRAWIRRVRGHPRPRFSFAGHGDAALGPLAVPADRAARCARISRAAPFVRRGRGRHLRRRRAGGADPTNS